MEPQLDETHLRLLRAIAELAAEHASQALTSWLGRPTRLQISEVEHVDPAIAVGLLGPEDATLAACIMGLAGPLAGKLILAFDDRSGLALADLVLGRPLGTAIGWDELEQSAALETANIVGCALLNSLAAHLPSGPADASAGPLVPSPPAFRHEFAASLIEFALMDQVAAVDRVVVFRSQFTSDEGQLDWSLLLLPAAESLATLAPDPSPRA